MQLFYLGAIEINDSYDGAMVVICYHLLMPLMIVRTGLEDCTLITELLGYGDYASTARFCFIPGTRQSTTHFFNEKGNSHGS